MLTLAYQLLKERLKAKVPALKEVAWYQEQNTDNAKGAIKVSPVAYIRFEPVQTKTFPLGWQRGNIVFDVIVCVDNYRDGDNRILETDPTLSSQVISDKIYSALNDYNALFSVLYPSLANTEDDYKVLNSITRTNITPSHENKAIIETTQTFTCLATDGSNVKKYRRPTQEVLDAIMENLLAGEGLQVKLIKNINDPV